MPFSNKVISASTNEIMAQSQIRLLTIYQWSVQENIEKMQEWGVIPSVLKCTFSNCTENMVLEKMTKKIDGHIWVCRSKEHQRLRKRKKSRDNSNALMVTCSIRSETFFGGSHLTLLQITAFVKMWGCYLQLDFIENELNITHATAVKWNRICYEITTQHCINNREKVGGKGHIVEIDESKMGKRKYHRGHYVEGQWVFGGVDRLTGKCFLVPVEKRDAATLVPLIEQYVEKGTTIISDCWRSYSTLGKKGYAHLTVNHKLHFKDPETGTHSNTIEGTWRHVKNKLPAYNRQKKFFVHYLSKFMFFKSVKKTNKDAVEEFFRAAAKLYNDGLLKNIT